MEVAETASSSPLEKTLEEDGAESTAPAKPRVVRVKRKREQAPLENICKPSTCPFPAAVDFSLRPNFFV